MKAIDNIHSKTFGWCAGAPVATPMLRIVALVWNFLRGFIPIEKSSAHARGKSAKSTNHNSKLPSFLSGHLAKNRTIRIVLIRSA